MPCALGIAPLEMLALPKIFALLIALPLLSVIAGKPASNPDTQQ